MFLYVYLYILLALSTGSPRCASPTYSLGSWKGQF
jgi:hypothetical protein